MLRYDTHMHLALRAAGYSTSDLEEIKRRLSAEPNRQAVLRDEFAKAALTGMNANPNWVGGPDQRARDAYQQADAMLLAARGAGMSADRALATAFAEFWTQAGCLSSSASELRRAIEERATELLGGST